MKTRLLFPTMLGLMVLLCLQGCADKQEVSCDSLKDVTIIASQSEFLPPAHSRTVVGDVQADGALVMNWGVDDAIGVFTADGNNLKFVNQNLSPSPNATFVPALGVTATTNPELGYYPYNPEITDRTAIPVTIPEVQEYSDLSSVAQYDIKAAIVDKQADGNFHLQMRQLASLVRFEINLPELKGVIEANGDKNDLSKIDFSTQHIKQVDIFTNDYVRLTGSYTYDLTQLNKGLSGLATDETSGALTVNLTQQPLLTSVDDLVFYAVVVPGKHLNNEITCEVQTEKIKLQFTTIIRCDFEAGKYYTLLLNAETISHSLDGSLSVVTTPDIDVPSGSVYPDANEETANCYMINTVGDHEFWGTQIGNGAKGIIKGVGFHTEDPYINPMSAKLVWQDVQNFVSDVTFNPADGKVHYKANKNSGNALIAVYDGPDGTGNVLWSWHIWGVGDTMPTDDEVTNRAGAKFMVMNRTLGSHAALSNMVTLYQWGRKDPFPNSSVYYLGDGSSVDISTTYPVFNPELESDVTLLASVQNCDKMMNAFKAKHIWNWLPADNQYLWGDTNIDDYYTWRDQGGLTNMNAGTGWNYPKTIYDPSPVGYRVANKFTFTGFSKRDDGVVSIKGGMNKGQIEQDANILVEYFVESPTVNRYHPKYQDGKFIGYFFKNNDMGNDASFYPMVGERFPNDGGSVSYVGESGGYYTSAPQKNQNSATYFHIGKYEWLDSDIVGGAAGNRISYKTMDFCDKLYARAIRCVRE